MVSEPLHTQVEFLAVLFAVKYPLLPSAIAPKARLVLSAVIVSGFASLASRSFPLVVAPLHAPRVAGLAASLKVRVTVSPLSGFPATPPALLVIATAIARK